MMYLIYWALISFAMGLFTSYYTVFLNRNLHIDKATSSLLVSISYAAIVLFMLFTPFVVKKMGTVGTICFTVLLSVPVVILDYTCFNLLRVFGFTCYIVPGQWIL